MEYRKQSLFDKYSIKPNIESNKLLILFQTNPLYRKDLPIIIQTIKNDEQLFIEELFTVHHDNNKLLQIHGKMIESINLLMNEVTIKELNIFNKLFLSFKSYNDYSGFYYYNKINSENSKNLIRQFLDCVIKEIYTLFIIEIDKIDTKKILWFYTFFKDNSQEYFDKFINVITTKLESLTTDDLIKDYHGKKHFIDILPVDVFKNEYVYRSYVFLVDRLFKKANEKFMCKEMMTIIAKLDKNYKKHFFTYVEKMLDYIFDLEGLHNHSFTSFKVYLNSLKNIYLIYIEEFDKKFLEKFDDFEEKLILLINILNNGESWYNQYNEKLQLFKKYPTELHIYDLIEHIILGNFPNAELKYFSLVLLTNSNFNKDFSKLIEAQEYVKYLTMQLKNDHRTNVLFYFLFENLDGIVTPSFCDEFLCKYYGFKLLDNEIVNEDLIKFVQSSILMTLPLSDCSYEMNNYSGIDNLTYKGLFLRDLLLECPEDFIIDGKTVRHILTTKFTRNYSSRYGVSKFSEFKSKYDKLSKKKGSKKRICDFVVQINNIYRNKEIYARAIEYLNHKQYKKAYELFISIKKFKDSEKKAELCLSIINKTNYESALQLMTSNQYDKAIELFMSMGDYLDSKEKIKQCEYNIKKDKYEIAIKYIERKEYDSAISKLQELGEFLDSEEKIEECIILKYQHLYDDALFLMNTGSYLQASLEFKKIESYKDSVNKIIECEELHKKSVYLKACKKMEEESYYDAIVIFTELGEFSDSNEMILKCKELIVKKENEALYADGLNYLYLFEKNKRKKDIKYAIKIFKKLSDIQFKDTNYLLEKCEKILKKKIIILLSIIFASISSIIISLLLVIFGICFNHLHRYNYNYAIKLSNEGYYEKATTVFTVLGNYKDSLLLKKITKHISKQDDQLDLDEIEYLKDLNVIVNLLDSENNTINFSENNFDEQKFVFMYWKILNIEVKFDTNSNIVNYIIYPVLEEKMYKIDYDLSGGVFHYNNVIDKYSLLNIVEMPIPSKVGYEFVGWTWVGNNEPVFNLYLGKDLFLNDVTLVANWEPIKYKINYYLNGGINSPNNLITYTILSSEDFCILSDATKVGYKFLGWYTNEDVETFVLEIDFSNPKDLSLYAKWEVVEYSISYDLAGGELAGEAVSKYTVEQTVELPKATKPEYRFLGWYAGEELVEKIEVGTTGDLELVAKWELDKYSISYDLAGGELNGAYVYDESKATQEFKLNKYINYAVDGTAASLRNKANLTWWGHIALKATADPEVFEIIQIANKSTGITVEFDYVIAWHSACADTTSKATMDAILKASAEYVGDYVVIKGIPAEAGDAEMTVKVFEASDITYETPLVPEYTQNDEIVLAEPTRFGYEFAGWYNGEELVEQIEVGTTGDLELVAKWEVVEYEIAYDLAGGAHVGAAPVAYTVQEEVVLGAAEKVGYVFLGWYAGEEKVEKVELGSTGNVALVAKWEVVEYALSFDLAGGKAENLPSKYSIEEAVELPAPAKVGYEFAGWTLNGEAFAGITETTKGDLNLVASWDLIYYDIVYETSHSTVFTYKAVEDVVNEFLVDFNKHNGTSYTANSLYELGPWGQIFDVPSFLYNEQYRTKWDWLIEYIAEFASESNKPAFEAFNKYNSVQEFNKANGDYIYLLSYEIRGWVAQKQYTKNKGYETADYSNANVSRAMFSYLPIPTSYCVESREIKFPILSENGYVFLGWYNEKGEKVVGITSGSIGNVKVTAKWEPNTFNK